MFCLHESMCITCTQCPWRPSDLLGLKSQTVTSGSVGAGKPNLNPLEEQLMCLTIEPSLRCLGFYFSEQHWICPLHPHPWCYHYRVQVWFVLTEEERWVTLTLITTSWRLQMPLMSLFGQHLLHMTDTQRHVPIS